jgi:hypothetical protein
MGHLASPVRLYVFGPVIRTATTGELILMAECEQIRGVQRLTIKRRSMQGYAERFASLRASIESGYPPYAEEDVRAAGEELYGLIIRGNTKEVLDKAVGTEYHFRPLELFFEDEQLASWPWEYAFNEKFLIESLYPISRGMFSRTPSVVKLLDVKKVRVLILLGVHPNDPEADPQKQIDYISRALNPNRFELCPIQIRAVTDIGRQFYVGEFHVIHYFGHGGFDLGRKQGYLEFEGATEASPRCYADQFAEAVAGKGVRLVFLNACETARSAVGIPLARSSMAAALLNEGVPAIIAAQFSTPASGAHLFAESTYKALAASQTLFEAVRAGRQAMRGARHSRFFDWGIPVLYTTDPNNVLFPPPNLLKPLQGPEAAGSTLL